MSPSRPVQSDSAKRCFVLSATALAYFSRHVNGSIALTKSQAEWWVCSGFVRAFLPGFVVLPCNFNH